MSKASKRGKGKKSKYKADENEEELSNDLKIKLPPTLRDVKG